MHQYLFKSKNKQTETTDRKPEILRTTEHKYTGELTERVGEMSSQLFLGRGIDGYSVYSANKQLRQHLPNLFRTLYYSNLVIVENLQPISLSTLQL